MPVTTSAWIARAARRLARVIEPDQQERGDRGQLPEREQRDHVVGEDQAQHRAHEQHQECQEPALVRCPRR